METLHGYCTDCPMRQPHHQTARHCILRENALLDDIEVKRMMDITAFSRWKTPNELARLYNYTPKHVIRLVSNPDNRIAGGVVDKRWFVLECTFARFVEAQGRQRRED